MRPRDEGSQVGLGFLLLLVINIAVVAVAIAIISALSPYRYGREGSDFYLGIAYGVVFYIGLFQILYVIPLVFLLGWQQRRGLMKGVIIGAVITALLNGGCFLLVFSATP